MLDVVFDACPVSSWIEALFTKGRAAYHRAYIRFVVVGDAWTWHTLHLEEVESTVSAPKYAIVVRGKQENGFTHALSHFSSLWLVHQASETTRLSRIDSMSVGPLLLPLGHCSYDFVLISLEPALKSMIAWPDFCNDCAKRKSHS
eukprot:1053250-Amphidinium_carterae.1